MKQSSKENEKTRIVSVAYTVQFSSIEESTERLSVQLLGRVVFDRKAHPTDGFSEETIWTVAGCALPE